MVDQTQSKFLDADDQSIENQEVTKQLNSEQEQPISYGPTVDALVGEGKKYKSIEDLAKAKAEADAFIEQIKSENSNMREDLGRLQAEVEKGKSLDEALDSIKRDLAEGKETTPALDEETLAKIIDSRLDSRTTEEKMAANKRVVDTALIKRFGEAAKAEAYIASKALELGTTVGELRSMSAKNPEMFFRVTGIETNSQEGNHGTPAGSQHNSEALEKKMGDKAPQHGTWEYYQNLRRTNPKAYYDPKIQNEIFAQRKKLGDEAFYKK